MKKCEDFELLINLSLDGFLTEEEQNELQVHLKNCAHCREAFGQLKVIREALSEMEEPVPAGLHEIIMASVANEAAQTVPKVKKFPLRKFCSCIAAVAACTAIGLVALRFAPSLDLAVQESVNDVNGGAMAPDSMQEAPESVTNGHKPTYDTEFKPSQDVVQPGYSTELPADPPPIPAPSISDDLTGQIAADLPPLRTENNIHQGSLQDAAICKWVKVSGRKNDMPEWVDWSSVYSTELDGVSYEYLQIKTWAETVWLDYFAASGFVVENMEGQDLDPNGECVLLFFTWQ